MNPSAHESTAATGTPAAEAHAAATGREGARPRPSAWRRVAGDVRAGARWSAPLIAERAARVGDWLARIGWGKFILLSILLLVFGGFLSSALFGGRPALVVERGPEPKVAVSVEVGPGGVRIAPAPTASPTAPKTSPAEAAVPPANGVALDEEGVRIVADKDGRQISIRIDGQGVRITEADAAGTSTPTGEVVVATQAAADPAKLAEALEAARGQIEQIVGDQVREQLAQRTRVYREESDDSFMSFIALLIVTGVIVKVVLGSKRKAEVRAQAASATAAEEGLRRQLAEAQLKMMQAQVEPHFLFNTLASVDYLIETDPARASSMQKNLIRYLREALPKMREGSTTLGKEVALCRAYLEILKVRMEDRLQFALTVPRALSSAKFPPMMLQSLVENAVKHGLEPKPEGGSLTLSAGVSHGILRVAVADTGLGFGVHAVSGTGVGLDNVRERLAALYGKRARLAVEANTPSGTIATIEVPHEDDESVASAADDAAARPL